MKEKNFIITSIVLFVIANVASYCALVEISHITPFDDNMPGVYNNTLGVIETLLKTTSFKIALLFFLGSAIAHKNVFVIATLVKLFLYTLWLILTHCGWNFLPHMSEIYSSGWMAFTWRQVATFMAIIVGAVFYLVGLLVEKKWLRKLEKKPRWPLPEYDDYF